MLGLPTSFLLPDVDIPSRLEETAGFGNLTYYVTSKFDLTAGVRVSKVEASVAVDDGPEILVADTPATVINDTVDTYSFSARYRPTDSLSLYARAASGYRPAAANLPLRDANGNNVAPVMIEADTLWSYEVGAKGYIADGKLSYDLVAWRLNWENLQARIYVNGVTTGGNANSNVTAYGFEGWLTYAPIDDLTLRPAWPARMRRPVRRAGPLAFIACWAMGVSGSYEDVRGDPLRQDRGLGTLAFSQELASGFVLTLSAVYATQPEFRGAVDKEWSSRLGLNYKLAPPTPK